MEINVVSPKFINYVRCPLQFANNRLDNIVKTLVIDYIKKSAIEPAMLWSAVSIFKITPDACLVAAAI